MNRASLTHGVWMLLCDTYLRYQHQLLNSETVVCCEEGLKAVVL